MSVCERCTRPARSCVAAETTNEMGSAAVEGASLATGEAGSGLSRSFSSLRSRPRSSRLRCAIATAGTPLRAVSAQRRPARAAWRCAPCIVVSDPPRSCVAGLSAPSVAATRSSRAVRHDALAPCDLDSPVTAPTLPPDAVQLLQSVSEGFEEKDKEVRVAAEIGQMLVEKNKQLIEQNADIEADFQLQVLAVPLDSLIAHSLIDGLAAREEGGRAARSRPEAEADGEAHR